MNSAPFDFTSIPNDHEIQQLLHQVVNTDVPAEGDLTQILRPELRMQTGNDGLDAPSKDAVTMEAPTYVAVGSKALARMSPTQRKAVPAYYLEQKFSQSKIEELIQKLRNRRNHLNKLIAELNTEE